MASLSAIPRPPILVLGLGNLLLMDDAVGLTLLQQLQELRLWGPDVEFVDGGTRGIALLGYIENRNSLIILDAVSLGGEPGAVSSLQGFESFMNWASAGRTAHEGNALQFLQTAQILGIAPARITVVGVTPLKLHTEIGLSDPVTRALPAAIALAASHLEEELQLLRATR